VKTEKPGLLLRFFLFPHYPLMRMAADAGNPRLRGSVAMRITAMAEKFTATDL
jgi:hypothetical protein